MTSISTLSTMQQSFEMRKTIARLEAERSKSNKEVVTGFQADIYATDSFRAAQTLDLRSRMARADSYAVTNKLLGGKLEIMSSQIGEIRSQAQDFVARSLSLSSGTVDDVVKTDADAAIRAIYVSLNTTYSGEFLFSGMDTSRMAVDSNASLIGHSGLTGGADTAGVEAALVQLDVWYGLDGATNTQSGYQQAVYSGSSDGLQSARLDDFTVVQVGMTADDVAVRQVLKGLSMLADPAFGQMTDAAAKTAWRNAALSALENGIAGLQYHESVLGSQEALVERFTIEQSAQSQLYSNRVVDIEGVDPYEAATKLESISTQLQASYQVTVKLQQLSLLNYL